MSNDYIIRWSNKSDIDQIVHLLYDSFGIMVENEGAFDGIEDGRYLILVMNDGAVVSCTGFQHHSDYPGIEITWTTTAPAHRHKGYMQKLFRRLLQTTDQPVYCCCWRIGEANRVNLQTLMDMFGFKEVVHNMSNYVSIHNCISPSNCPYWKSSNEGGCRCAKDLYLREVERLA